MNKLIVLIPILFSFSVFAQQIPQKQSNTPSAELFADAPYICKKTDTNDNPASIPILFICHDGSAIGATIDLISIKVKAKAAGSGPFGEVISFSEMTNEDFLGNVVVASTENESLDIQSFDFDVIENSSTETFKFNDEMNIWIPPVYYEKIDGRWWYFVYNMPYESFDECGDTIDFEVYFDQDYATDDIIYLRVIRTDEAVPEMQGWYRGDTHYHSMFTDNLAEMGFPPDIVAYMAKTLSIDWITITDHSCDYDNYGQSMANNWTQLGNMVLANNQNDTAFKFIRGIEMSVNNSDDHIVHCLAYPSEEAPFSMPYLGDGGGDSFGTEIDLDGLFEELLNCGGFAYAAHPFAEGDALGVFVNGGSWNLGHPGFKQNGEAHTYSGTVICNDISLASDVYTADGMNLKPGLLGFEILNMRNRLSVADEMNNPWNATNDGTDAFGIIDTFDTYHYLYRYRQNLEVYFYMLQKALLFAESENINYKIFQSAGSDAHGSFNYSNTDYSFGVTGSVTDNAIGKFSTLVYCPEGMGNNAENVLMALRNGRTILSEGPLVSIEVTNDALAENYYIGDDASVNYTDLLEWKLNYNYASSGLYGNVNYIKFIVGTKDYLFEFYADTTTDHIHLYDLIAGTLGDDYYNGMFFIMAEIRTSKPETPYIDPMGGFYYAYTNPIWIELYDNTQISEFGGMDSFIYPNPASDFIDLQLSDNDNDNYEVSIYGINNDLISKSKHNKSNPRIHLANLKDGVYTVKLKSARKVRKQKLVVVK